MRFPTRAAFQRVVTVAVLLLAYAGCDADRDLHKDTEQMLITAGFHMEPADTPEKEAQLKTFPPHTLLAQPLQAGGSGTTGYVYADPDECHCVFVGDAKAYQTFARLAASKPPGSFPLVE